MSFTELVHFHASTSPIKNTNTIKTSTQWWLIVGPPSATLAQHSPNNWVLWQLGCTSQIMTSAYLAEESHFLYQYVICLTGALDPSQRARDIYPMLGLCWATVSDAGPTLPQHWVNVSCLLRWRTHDVCVCEDTVT